QEIELGADHGDQREAGTGTRSDPHETVPPQLAASSLLHAQQWLTRRLKRHFQDQQTHALRAVRSFQEAASLAEVRPASNQIIDAVAGIDDTHEVIVAALAMTGLQADVESLTNEIEGETHALLTHALAPRPSDEPRTVQDRVRDVFRRAI